MFTIEDDPPDLAVFIDMSGSALPYIDAIKSFIKLYHEKIPTLTKLGHSYCIHFVSFDDRIMEIIKVTPTTIDNLLNFKYYFGGGGSDLQCCWDYMHQNQMQASIVFTDGMIPWGADPGLEITFLLHSDIKLHSYPSYGTTHRYIS